MQSDALYVSDECRGIKEYLMLEKCLLSILNTHGTLPGPLKRPACVTPRQRQNFTSDLLLYHHLPCEGVLSPLDLCLLVDLALLK